MLTGIHSSSLHESKLNTIVVNYGGFDGRTLSVPVFEHNESYHNAILHVQYACVK